MILIFHLQDGMCKIKENAKGITGQLLYNQTNKPRSAAAAAADVKILKGV